MIAYAARYGHQQEEQLSSWPVRKIVAFNEGLTFWIEKENQSGTRRADGG